MTTVLVVDDDPDTRTLICRRLEREGFTVHSADNGSEAVGDAMTLCPEAVVMDYRLVTMNGATTLGLLRRMGYRGKVILISALDQCEWREECMRAGADRCVRKPLRTCFTDIVKETLQEGTPACGVAAAIQGPPN